MLYFQIFLALMGFVFLALIAMVRAVDEMRRERLERQARVEDVRNTWTVQ